MSNRIGIMQGRLSPAIDGKIQDFPSKTWKEEFQLAQEIGFEVIEWVIVADSLDKNPVFNISGRKEIKSLQENGYKFIDIRTKKERDHTGIIPGSLEITAFDIYGNFVPEFMKTFRDLVELNDNTVFISNEGEIASMLANGFVEQLQATNMYALEGGIQELIRQNFKLEKK